MSWGHDCSMLVEMLFFVCHGFKQCSRENVYHCKFPEVHSWYVVLPSESPILLILSERVVMGAGGGCTRCLRIGALRADTSLSSLGDPSSQETESVGGSVGAGLGTQVCSILLLLFSPRVWLKPSNPGAYLQTLIIHSERSVYLEHFLHLVSKVEPSLYMIRSCVKHSAGCCDDCLPDVFELLNDV